VAPSLRQAFVRKAHRFGGVSEVLRELVAAFVDNRLTIQPPEKTKESIYDNRI
jgi:dihydroxyacid dehydratase/phosphogluconate dehydratase